MADLAIWKDEVGQRQHEVPSENEEILEEPRKRGDKEHGQQERTIGPVNRQ